MLRRASGGEAFEAFFTRFLGLKAERVLHAHERLTYLLFCIHALQSLENAVVWGQVKKLVSLSLWHSLSPARLQVGPLHRLHMQGSRGFTCCSVCIHCRGEHCVEGAGQEAGVLVPVTVPFPCMLAGRLLAMTSDTFVPCFQLELRANVAVLGKADKQLAKREAEAEAAGLHSSPHILYNFYEQADC